MVTKLNYFLKFKLALLCMSERRERNSEENLAKEENHGVRHTNEI
jgi:hypothetical protein